MNNWFSVGEQVLLISVSQPQHNGEYTIKDIIRDRFCDITTGIIEDNGVGIDLGFRSDEGSRYWDIKAIRKKHKPSSEDFQSLMDTLKTNIIERVE